MEKRIYLDHSATTPVKKETLEAMLPYLTRQYGNPSSIYTEGREARKALEKARDIIAEAIGAQSEELFFTASGTEADNWALRGIADAYSKRANISLPVKLSIRLYWRHVRIFPKKDITSHIFRLMRMAL